MASDEAVVVATIAFGMGIGGDSRLLPRIRINAPSLDKANIRQVL